MQNQNEHDFTDPYEMWGEEEDYGDWTDENDTGYQCILGDACIMLGLHYPSECHTAEDLEQEYKQYERDMNDENYPF